MAAASGLSLVDTNIQHLVIPAAIPINGQAFACRRQAVIRDCDDIFMVALLGRLMVLLIETST